MDTITTSAWDTIIQYFVNVPKVGAIWLFSSATANSVYRFIRFQQNRKPTSSAVPDKSLLLPLSENSISICRQDGWGRLPARRIGQRRPATAAPSRCSIQHNGSGRFSEPSYYLLSALMR